MDAKRMNKRGQVTIFIIIAIMIVVVGILIYLYSPKIKSTLGFEEKNPVQFIEGCLKEDVETAVSKLSLRGGSMNPENYVLYGDEKIEYLCYTNQYYISCVMQQPMLKEHIENEIKNEIKSKADECFDSMKESFKARGYNVNLKKGPINVELLPKRIVTTFDHVLTLTKDSSETHEKFKIVLNNNLYELVSIANSILNMEASFGDAETTNYMNYYHDLKVEKKKQTDGTTIYILEDRNKGDKFQFASRSIAWPPGI